MKRLVLSALLALAVIAPANAQSAGRAAPSPLADFSFKDATAGTQMDPNTVGRCAPPQEGVPGQLECRGHDNVVAGVRLLLAPDYYFYNNRLTSMIFLYDARGTDFLTFLGAFRDRYGAPCETSTEQWQNRAGANFDNQTATWCFRTGRLKLEQLGPSLNYGSVTYTDNYSAPTRAAPRDF